MLLEAIKLYKEINSDPCSVRVNSFFKPSGLAKLLLKLAIQQRWIHFINKIGLNSDDKRVNDLISQGCPPEEAWDAYLDQWCAPDYLREYMSYFFIYIPEEDMV